MKISNLHKDMKSKSLKGGMLWTDDSYVNPPIMLGLNYKLLSRMKDLNLEYLICSYNHLAY
jgi:hypothetical protein